MGLLETLIAARYGRGAPPSGASYFDSLPGASPSAGFPATADDPAADPTLDQTEAEAAREAAAKRLQRSIREPWGYGASAVPYIDAGAGMLSAGGSAGELGAGGSDPGPMPDLPPSTNDPAAREPEVFQGNVPLPRPRPVTPNAPAAAKGEAPAPLSMSPPMEPKPTDAFAQAGALPGMGASVGGSNPIANLLRSENAPLLLSMAGGFAGAPSFGTGMRRAFSGAAPAAMQMQKLDMQKTSMSETYKALIARGVDPQEAIAAVRNPDLMKALASKYFETAKPEWKEVARNRWGEPIHGLVNTQAGTINGKPMAVFQAEQEKINSGGGSPIPVGPGGYAVPGVGQDRTGPQAGERDTSPALGTEDDATLPASARLVQYNRNEDYLTSLNDAGFAAKVKAISEGREPFPSGQVMRTPYGKRLSEAIGVYDPTFDAVNFTARQGTRKDYTSGIASRVTKSVNTTIDHGWQLYNIVDKLPNNSLFPVLNAPMNAVRGQLDPKYQKLRADFDSNKEAFVKELDFALSGGKPTVSGQQAIRHEFDANSSPETMRGYISTAMKLLKSRLDSHTEGYNTGMGTTKDPIAFINEKNRANFRKLTGEIGDEAAAAPAPAAGALPSGRTSTGVQWSVQ